MKRPTNHHKAACMLRTIPIWTMVVLAGLFIAGCKNEDASQAAKPRVVKQKISLPGVKTKAPAQATHVAAAKKPANPPAKATSKPIPHAAVGAVKKIQKTPPSAGAVAKASGLPAKSKSAVASTKTANQTNSTTPAPKALGDLITQAETLAAAAYRPKIYHPEGKIDPFMPLFRKEEATAPKLAHNKVLRREPKTPLETSLCPSCGWWRP